MEISSSSSLSQQIKMSQLQPITSKSSMCSTSRVGFDVTFSTISKYPVIQSELIEMKDNKGKVNQNKSCEVNTFCKIPHCTIGQKKVKGGLEDYIEGLVQKILGINSEIEQQKENKEKLTNENLKLIFNNEDLAENSKNCRSEIAAIKKDIQNLRLQLQNEYKQKADYEFETIRIKKEIIEKQDEVKKLQNIVNQKIKEVAELQRQVNEAKKKVEQMKIKLGRDQGNTSNTFVKDVMKLIPASKKKKF